MNASLFHRVTLAIAVSASAVSPALAGGGGHGGGAVFHGGGGFHGGGFHGGWGGGARAGGGWHPMPPVAGIIHERAGMRPYFSAYGHTNTATRFGEFSRGGVPAYGHTATALPSGGGFGFGGAGYGHVNTALRYGAERRFAAIGEGRRRFAERSGYGRFAGGYGGFGGGNYGFGGGIGLNEGGTYGGEGTYGGQGTYGQSGTYGGTATQSLGTGEGLAYRSETPLAARFAEAPLAPSPGAPYSAGDRYAYAASADVWPTPRVVNPFRHEPADCVCGAQKQPVVYRYGIGTAY